MEEKERGRNLSSCVSQLTPSSALISAFSQAMEMPSLSEVDETDFNQFGANPTDLGIWEYSPFINYFDFLINKFVFRRFFT